MAAKATRSTARKPARRKTRARAAPAPKAASGAPKMTDLFKMPDPTQLAKYAKTLTPEQAFEMYRANAKLALEVIENALESTAKVRKLQYEGEERARSMQRKTARGAAEAGDVQSLMAVGQNAAQEAVEQSIAVLGPDVRADRRDAEAAVLAHGKQSRRAAGRKGGTGRDGDAARPDQDAECRFGDAGLDVIEHWRIRANAEGDGGRGAHVRLAALGVAGEFCARIDC